MTSERQLWHTTRTKLSIYGKVQRIESPLVSGVPDVIYCLLQHTGWLELKEVGGWPARTTTTLSVPSLTLEQVLFSESWSSVGGAAHLLLQVGPTYLLLDCVMMRKIFARQATQIEIELSALARGVRKFPTRAIVRALTVRGPRP